MMVREDWTGHSETGGQERAVQDVVCGVTAVSEYVLCIATRYVGHNQDNSCTVSIKEDNQGKHLLFLIIYFFLFIFF
jgi:hypothetical protein